MSKKEQLEKLSKVADLLEMGLGRRRIAKQLGISEWEARALISAVLPANNNVPEDIPTKIEHTVNRNKIIPTTYVGQTVVKISPSVSTRDHSNKVSTGDVTCKVACVSDIHYPYQDQRAEEIALSYIKDYKPDILIWNGDIFDFYAVSAYEKSIKKKMDIQEEIDHGFERMKLWMKEVNPKQSYFRMGNHESRLSRFTGRQANALTALRSLDIENNIPLDSIGVTYVPDPNDLWVGNMLYVHGTVVRKNGGDSARGHHDQYGTSVLMGHTHRLSVAYKRNKFGTHTMVENGTLCDMDAEYVQYPNWQHGFTTLDYHGNDFTVNQHAIINYKLIAGGKVYTS